MKGMRLRCHIAISVFHKWYVWFFVRVQWRLYKSLVRGCTRFYEASILCFEGFVRASMCRGSGAWRVL